MKINYRAKLIKCAIGFTYVLDVLFVLTYILFNHVNWVHNERLFECHGKIAFIQEKRTEYAMLQEQLP